MNVFFFFQAEDGIRDIGVTGVQTCALPIWVCGTITSFKSYCGGLIAPQSDDNPWHYKFSWNPKNIITAGLGGAKYLSANKHVEVPYEKIFENNKKIKVDDLGMQAYYPNRDSLKYLDTYDIPEIKTFLRATLRYPSFCK